MYFLIRIKNFLKRSLSPDSPLYAAARYVYGNVVFPLQKTAYRRRAQDDSSSGAFSWPEELYMCSLFPKELLDFVLDAFHPQSVLDVGCGTGVSLQYFVQHGVDGTGLEGSAMAISHSAVGKRIIKHDLAASIDLGRRFDLVWCYEVAEHLPEALADTLVETICRHGNGIVFSAAVPGQGGSGHVNLQPPEYWVEKFRKHGFASQAATSQARKLKNAGHVLVFSRTA